MSLTVIHEKCEKKAAEDKTLPKNAYIVTYVSEDKMVYDIVMADSKVDIFDEYWDKYKEGLQNIDYTHGQVRPSMWPLGSSNGKGKKVTKKPRKRENG
tara:strand:- start:411 stop:704 length:294 start_codon:yes stop_codon:yes gene_type:complete